MLNPILMPNLSTNIELSMIFCFYCSLFFIGDSVFVKTSFFFIADGAFTCKIANYTTCREYCAELSNCQNTKCNRINDIDFDEIKSTYCSNYAQDSSNGSVFPTDVSVVGIRNSFNYFIHLSAFLKSLYQNCPVTK